MVRRLYLHTADGTEPFVNQAVERTLLTTVPEDALILYLWRNAHTVVIGRNQDCYDECRVLELEASGGRLARRITGGGAVYHDAGNLNFTFLVRRPDYDVPRQTGVIVDAVSRFGIRAEVNGRNDLLAQGRKFSGHAYRVSDEGCCHHGTLLVDADADMLSRYLNVNADKLAGKGIRSVRARVVNLRELCPSLDADALADALSRSASRAYGLPVEPLPAALLPQSQVESGTAFFSDDGWRYGSRLAHAKTVEARFAWGGVKLEWIAQNGSILDACAYSDALEWDLVADIPDRLRGCAAEEAAVRAALCGNRVYEDVAGLLLANL